MMLLSDLTIPAQGPVLCQGGWPCRCQRRQLLAAGGQHRHKPMLAFCTKQDVHCGPFILHCSIGVLSVQYGVYKSINISRQRNSNSPTVDAAGHPAAGWQDIRPELDGTGGLVETQASPRQTAPPTTVRTPKKHADADNPAQREHKPEPQHPPAQVHRPSLPYTFRCSACAHTVQRLVLNRVREVMTSNLITRSLRAARRMGWQRAIAATRLRTTARGRAIQVSQAR